MQHYGTLEILWFVLIVALWIGYFFLEGFDFGVGMLLRVLGRDRTERSILMQTIGPVWDGNEVWLIAAGGATFAAFPEWYATLLSGFYVVLFLIVATLLLRPVAFEFWGKDDHPSWRNACEWALVVGSVLPPFLWGVTFSNIVRGIPIGSGHEFTGTPLDLLSPYALLGGVTFVLLCAAHGAFFLRLKTRDDMLARAGRAARLLGVPAAVAGIAFLGWTVADVTDPGAVTLVAAALAAGALVGAAFMAVRRSGLAFGLLGLGFVSVLVTLFSDLYPNVLISSTTPAFNLTLGNAASGHYTLEVMTVVAAIFVPVVVLAQGWTYWIFRRRVGREEIA
jgi:cytochrome d ubiquinol oxidase subunit II